MVDDADRLADGWHDGEELDAHREMMRLALGIAGKTLFGAEVGGAQAAEIGEALDSALRLFRRALVPFAGLIDRLPLPSNRRFFRSRDRLDATIFRMIRERRASGEDTGDLLSMLILARDPEGDGATMSDEQVRDEAVTLLLAGHETTANALAWSWYLLARHPAAEAALAQVIVALARQQPLAEQALRAPHHHRLDEAAVARDEHLAHQLGVADEEDARGPDPQPGDVAVLARHLGEEAERVAAHRAPAAQGAAERGAGGCGGRHGSLHARSPRSQSPSRPIR
jgi:hypothetical protein